MDVNGFANGTELPVSDAAVLPESGPAPAATKLQGAGSLSEGPTSLAASFGHQLSLASRSVHADDYINSHRAVAPPMHVSTTFRYSNNPDNLVVWENIDV